MAKKRKFFYRNKPQYPVIQGNLADDSVTELCSTGLHKTTFNLIRLDTGNVIPCVLWAYMKPILKGQLVAAEGFLSHECFICKDVKKINVPYSFG